MDVIRIYQRKIVENKNFVFVSIFLAMLLRIALFNLIDDISIYSYKSSSSLWGTISLPFGENKLVSFFLAILFTIGIALYSVHLNIKYSLIRVRTYLIYSIVFLLFSCHPAFLTMNIQYICIFLFLRCVDILFSSYQEVNTSGKAYSIGFILAVASLFSVYILFYLILFWIGFGLMRSFNIKSAITSLLGVCTIYWLALFYFLWNGDLSSSISFYTSIPFEFGLYFKLLTATEYVLSIFNILLLLIVILNNQLYSFQDKIRVRAKIAFINVIAVFSLISVAFINLDPVIDLYIYCFSYAILLSHFFTIAEQKWKIYLFYIFLISIFVNTLPFLFKL